MGLLLSILFGFVPMFLFGWFVYWLDRYEKEPKVLLGGAFLWGAIVAAGAAFIINTTLGIGIYLTTGSENAADFATGSFIAPVVEECLKGFAVLLVFIFFYKEFDSVLDGIIYAAVTALGFAATENSLYIYTKGFLEKGYPGLLTLVFIRVILVGWQHPYYTAFFGIGLAITRLNRNIFLKISAPIIGICIGILAHSIHNTLLSILPGFTALIVGTAADWTGWIAMFIFILWMIYNDRKLLLKYLQEEVTLGTITDEQYYTACSAAALGRVRIKAILHHRYQSTNRFYQLCGELAHKKNQFTRVGEEGNNTAIIHHLQEQLIELSPTVV